MGLEHRRYLNVGLLSVVLTKMPNWVQKALSVSGEEIVAAGICSSDPKFRWHLFDALRSAGTPPAPDLYYAKSRPEPFLVSLGDEWGPGRELFVFERLNEFDKFDSAWALIKKHRPAPEVLIDVGANIGTICVAATVRKFVSRAIAIEPDPLNCRLMRANIAINGLHNFIEVIEKAAGMTDDETLALDICENNLGGHAISCFGAASAEDTVKASIQVKSVSLDSLLSEVDKSRVFIWMDVQGYEGFVLKGASQILSHLVPVVLEFDPAAMQNSMAFEALQEAVSHYRGFYDLRDPKECRPVNELADLSAELKLANSFTDILLL